MTELEENPLYIPPKNKHREHRYDHYYSPECKLLAHPRGVVLTFAVSIILLEMGRQMSMLPVKGCPLDSELHL